MKYTVIFVPAAETMLTNIYLQASPGPDRQAVTAAANTIDQELAQDPEKKGQPFGRFYILEIDPLSVLYEVDPGDCMVRVFSVKRLN